MKKIILSGYMGAGKSTVAKELHEKTGLEFIDMDNVIEQKTQFSIPEIFKNKGEIYFRKLETEMLSELMKLPTAFILSLGGGTPCYGNNAELLQNENAVTFYLKASIETLYARLTNQKEKRPLLAAKPENDFKEYIAKHLFERNQFYNLADYKIDTDNKLPVEIASEILGKLA
jgi:shikimate kinase